MDAKLIVTKWDMEQLPMSWYQYKDGCWQIEQKLKEAVGSRWDNSRLMFDCYGLFAFQIHRRKSHSKKSILAESASFLGEVKLYGEKHPTWGYDTNIWEWHIWDVTGNHTLGIGMFLSEPDQPMPKDLIRELIKICDDFNHDICTCSGCGKKINKTDIAGAYFAGRYCTHCWETKYRAIEARENYS